MFNMVWKPRIVLAHLTVSFIVQLLMVSPTTGNGLKLNLFHNVPKNLTFEERYLRNVRTSHARVAPYLTSAKNSSSSTSAALFHQMNTIRQAVQLEGDYYAVEIKVGTFPFPEDYELLLDTASPLTWTQCYPAQQSFATNYPLFNYATSETHQVIGPRDPLCGAFEPIQRRGPCRYSLQYGSQTGAATSGFLLRERFRFSNNVVLDGLILGCSTHSANFYQWSSTRQIAGILGMDRHPASMVNELKATHSYSRRFSYCLRSNPQGGRVRSYLSIGDQIHMTGYGTVQSTSFIGDDEFYRLNLVGMTVRGALLQISPRDFRRSGCTIDSGAPKTLLDRPLYRALINAISQDLDGFARLANCPSSPCFRLPSGYDYRELPSLQFWFGNGAVLDVPPENLFSINFARSYFMLAMAESGSTLIGAKQQHNHRFLYDLEEQELSWVPANCDQDDDD